MEKQSLKIGALRTNPGSHHIANKVAYLTHDERIAVLGETLANDLEAFDLALAKQARKIYETQVLINNLKRMK